MKPKINPEIRTLEKQIKLLEKEGKIKEDEIDRLNKSIQKYSSHNKTYTLDCDRNCVKVAVVSDTHFGSLYSAIDKLNSFYELANDEGFHTFLHGGDMTDGHRVYRGQEYETYAIGFENQLDVVKNQYPKIKGAKTYFICGNHDTSFKTLSGSNVGKRINEVRNDLIYLGDDQANLSFELTDGSIRNFMLQHPMGGTAYALSYKLQKAVESLPGGTKPDAFIQGHYHKAAHLPAYRNVEAISPGCFQEQTPFMKRLGTPAHVGGWLITDYYGKGMNRFQAEFIPFYEENKKSVRVKR